MPEMPTRLDRFAAAKMTVTAYRCLSCGHWNDLKRRHNNQSNHETKMPTQTKTAELPNMPKPDAIGLHAQNLRTAIEKLDAASEEKGEAIDKLMKAMRRAKRHNIRIDGYVFEFHHQGAKDSIKVVKPK